MAAANVPSEMTEDRNPPPAGRPGVGALLVRYGLPAALVVAGVVAIVIGGGTSTTAAAGVVLLGVALMVWLINWMFRMSVASNRDREREEEAREQFSRTGRWPDEPGDGRG